MSNHPVINRAAPRRQTRAARPTARPGGASGGLRTLRHKVAGIDLGATEHYVCGPERADGQPNLNVFGTTTGELERLAEWLRAEGVESVAMESTGVYWIPLFELLEAQGFEVVLVSARQLRGVPARKSDVLDCQWLQMLHSCGLLRAAFRPAPVICRVRALQRERDEFIAERTRVVQRLQKNLDQMNVQIHRAVTDLTGVTGLAILRAIVAGERDPHVLAQFRDRRCKKSCEQIAAHLTGTWKAEHLFNLQMGVRQFDHLEGLIAAYDAQILRWLEDLQPPERREEPVPAHPNPTKEKALRARGDQALRTALWRVAGVDLTRIDAIGATAAQIVLTEVGLDLQRFPTEDHFASWTRLSPKTAITGGHPVHTRRNSTGATRIAAVLRMAALSLKNSPTALGAYYRRLARRAGARVAVFATARKLAILIYRMLRYGHDYLDQGAAAYEARFQRQRLSTLRSTALQLGYQLVPVSDAA